MNCHTSRWILCLNMLLLLTRIVFVHVFVWQFICICEKLGQSTYLTLYLHLTVVCATYPDGKMVGTNYLVIWGVICIWYLGGGIWLSEESFVFVTNSISLLTEHCSVCICISVPVCQASRCKIVFSVLCAWKYIQTAQMQSVLVSREKTVFRAKRETWHDSTSIVVSLKQRKESREKTHCKPFNRFKWSESA